MRFQYIPNSLIGQIAEAMREGEIPCQRERKIGREGEIFGRPPTRCCQTQPQSQSRRMRLPVLRRGSGLARRLRRLRRRGGA